MPRHTFLFLVVFTLSLTACATSAAPSLETLPSATAAKPSTATPTNIPTPTLSLELRSTPIPEPVTGAGVHFYGGDYMDIAHDVLVSANGDILIAGEVNNSHLEPRNIPGGYAHLSRFDQEGNLIWAKEYGGNVLANFYSIAPAGDDEYVLLGDIVTSEINEKSDLPGVSCNPIMQAEQLNASEVGLVVTMGLCLGHDILFNRYLKVDSTNLVVKDRTTGHNPLQAIRNLSTNQSGNGALN